MKGRTYCVARAPNDVSYKNNTHIPGIFIHYFPKDVAVWPKWTRSTIDRRHRGDFLLFNIVCLMLRTGLKDPCYEHISLVKSGEDKSLV